MARRVDAEAARALAGAGWTVADAAVGLGCSEQALRAAAGRGGFSFAGSRVHLDVGRVRELAEEGLTPAQAAEALGCRPGTIRQCAARHGIAFARSKRADEWDERELGVLAEVYPAEGTLAAANALGRSPYAVASKASRLGLRRERGAKGIADSEPWGAPENAALFGLWGHPLAEAAARLGRGETDVARHSRAMGVELAG